MKSLRGESYGGSYSMFSHIGISYSVLLVQGETTLAQGCRAGQNSALRLMAQRPQQHESGVCGSMEACLQTIRLHSQHKHALTLAC